MFGKRATGKAALVVDCDDVSVGCAVVDLSASGPVPIVLAERVFAPLEQKSQDQSASGIVQLMEQCADKVLKAYLASGTKDARVAPPTTLQAIVRAPWTRFRTAQAEEVFEELRTITKDMIPALAKKALGMITDLDAARVVESGIMQVFLNGYPTGSPIGKKARTLSVTAFQGDIDPTIRKGIADVFAKLLPGVEPTIRTGVRSLVTVLNEHVPDIHRYVILALCGSSTACAVVRKEMLTQSGETHEGFATILRRVAGSGVPEETLSQLRMLGNDTCSTDACRATKDALAKAEPDLVKAYGEMFGSLAERRRLPNNAILVSHADLAPWLEAFFSRIDFAQFTATTQPLSVESLTPDHLQAIVTWRSGARQDTELAIAVACVHILEHTREERV